MKKQVKKILLVFFIIILLGGAVTIFIVNKNKDNTKVSGNFETENETKEENVIIADITKDNENVTDDPNAITEENIVKEETETVVENTSTKQEQTKDNIKTYLSTGGTSENKTQNNSTINNTPTNNNDKPKIETSLPNQGSNIDKVEEPAKEEEATEPPKQDVHTYKYNSSIVNKITNDIKNNESEYMKKYGYNIVVDESIVNLTNQFTYTTNRVKDKIINKFGTIKIYARDYYLNGDYMYTEAYIL